MTTAWRWSWFRDSAQNLAGSSLGERQQPWVSLCHPVDVIWFSRAPTVTMAIHGPPKVFQRKRKSEFAEFSEYHTIKEKLSLSYKLVTFLKVRDEEIYKRSNPQGTKPSLTSDFSYTMVNRGKRQLIDLQELFIFEGWLPSDMFLLLFNCSCMTLLWPHEL